MAYPGIDNLSINSTKEVLKYPLSGNPWFYGIILFGLWVIFTLNLFFRDKERLGLSNFLSASSVSAFAVVVIAFLGTLVEVISTTVMSITLALFIVLLVLWFISDR